MRNVSRTLKNSIKSALYVPSTQEKMLSKCVNLKASIVIPDLEDSVPDLQKENALDNLVKKLPFIAENITNTGTLIFPRVNDITTSYFLKEVNILTSKENIKYISGLHIPKISRKEELIEIDKILSNREKELNLKEHHIKVFPNFESAKGVIFLKELLDVIKNRVDIAGFGGDDFSHDILVKRSEEDFELDFARKLFALTCLAYNVIPIDTPYVHYKNHEGLKRELAYIKRIGFKAKFAIHPTQIEIINEAFSTKPAKELEEAENIVKLYEEAIKKGIGAISYNNQMIDMPIYKKAKEVLMNKNNKF